MNRIHAFAAAAIVAGGIFSVSAPAFALGSEPETPQCPRGQVYDQTKKECVAAAVRCHR